jgi:hypothetical protein
MKKVVRVNKVTPVTQTDYLRMLGEVMVQMEPKSYDKRTVDERKELHVALMSTLARKGEMK